MSTQPKPFLTVEEFLANEEKAEFRSEYFAGETFAMAGGTENHTLIKVRLAHLIEGHLEDRQCRVYDSDLMVRVVATGLLTYPDVSVVCGPSQLEGGPHRDRVLLNPNLIIEVLSPSTEAYDRGRKFEHYRTIPSLEQFVLVSSERVHADVFTRGNDDLWVLASCSKPDDVMHLTSIGCTIRLGDLYKRTDLLEPAPAV